MPSRKEVKKRAQPTGATASRPAAAVPWGLLAAAVAAILYLPALANGWVWDDSILVASRGSGGAAGEGYGPVAQLLYRLEWLVAVGEPAFFHFTSALLYAVATWLVFRLARGLGAALWLAFGAALLFAAHPAHVEAVAYVSGRPDLLATTLALAALAIARSAPVCAPGGCRSWRVWPAYGLLALAVLSGEVALVTPVALIALDRWGSPRVTARGRAPLYAGFTAVAVAGILTRLFDRSFHAATVHAGVPPEAAWRAPLLATFDYLRMLALPTRLSAIRSLGAHEASDGGLLIASVLSIVAVAAFVFWRRRDPLARAGAILLALPLIPALPLPFFQGAYVEERAVFFASVGFVLLVASLLAWLADALPAGRRAATAVTLAAAAAAGFGTLARIPAWRDNVSLLQAAVLAAPDDPETYYRLGQNHYALGEFDAALVAVNRSIALDSTFVDAHHLRTALLSHAGRFPEAEAETRRSIGLDPRDAVAWANLGDALMRQGKLPEALEACRRAVTLDSTLAGNWYNLGVALGSSGDAAGAGEAYRRAIAIEPGHVAAWNNLGAALAATGRLQESCDAYRRAVALAPGSVESRMNLAIAYIRIGDKADAMRERDTVRRIDRAMGFKLDEIFRSIGSPPPR
ncbi:MAG TPA: tetratricopeptide repeat protein [Candidatus Eisenbacteria bacterium]